MIENFDIDVHSITARALAHNGRDIASQLVNAPEVAHQLVRFKRGKSGQHPEHLGDVISLGRALTILSERKKTNKQTRCKHISAREFQKAMQTGKNYFDDTQCDIAFVTKRAEQGVPADVIAVLSPRFYDETKDIAFKGKPPKQSFPRQSSHLNSDEGIYDVPANNFYKLIAEVERRVAAGEPVFSKDGRYCAIPVETALKLKSHLFPEDANIIVDQDTAQIANQGLDLLDNLLDNGKFVRVTKAKTGKQIYTVIPAALGEFLNLNIANGIGIRSERALTLSFNVRASVHTDFDGKFFAHLIPHQERAKTNGEIRIELPKGQAAFARSAILSGDAINIGGHALAFQDTHKSRLKHQDKSSLHVDSDAHLSMKIKADGTISDLRLAFSTQNDILAIGLERADTVSICINSQVYGLHRN